MKIVIIWNLVKSLKVCKNGEHTIALVWNLSAYFVPLFLYRGNSLSVFVFSVFLSKLCKINGLNNNSRITFYPHLFIERERERRRVEATVYQVWIPPQAWLVPLPPLPTEVLKARNAEGDISFHEIVNVSKAVFWTETKTLLA